MSLTDHAAPSDTPTRPGLQQHVHTVPARSAVPVDWPLWVPEAAVAALARCGVQRPWRHQVEAAESVRGGRPTVIATSTASGKSLGYLLPIITDALDPPDAPATRLSVGGAGRGGVAAAGRRRPDAVAAVRGVRAPTALYLSPTKALAHDQLRSCLDLRLDRWRVGTLDGDSSEAERRFAREHAHLVLTNPDMLHRSVLPSHQRWARLLGSLRYVVVDESHRYRGVFGSHVSAVLRRLRRLCRHHGADPVLVLASATVAEPGLAAGRLTGVAPERFAVVSEDGSPHGPVTITMRRPREGVDEAATTTLVAQVEAGRQVLAFLPSRVRSELVALSAADRLAERGLQRRDGHGPPVEAYRSGYLPRERREIEARLTSGATRGVAATNALELGIDIAGLDAVVIGGWPGTTASFWQQAGRAGRRGGHAEVTLLAREDPLDLYLLDHPELVFSGRVEAQVLHPANPYVLGPHLAAAAQELPLEVGDTEWFGETMPATADRLATQGVLRRRARGWFWVRPDRAVDSIDLRGSGSGRIEITETGTGNVVGYADPATADRSVHEGAVYLHRGEVWVVEGYDPDAGESLARAGDPGYRTQAQSVSDVTVLGQHRRGRLPGASVFFGEVEVSSQVTGYLRRDPVDGTIWDSTPLDLPRRVLRTQSMWLTVDDAVLDDLGLGGLGLGGLGLEGRGLDGPGLDGPGFEGSGSPQLALAGAAHAAEHTAIGLLPAFAPCDRWDIGGLSTPLHPDTGACTIFVHDGHPGGAGFAERGFEVVTPWLTATLERLRRCGCETGCPSCVVSPKCGNQNQVLDKSAARSLLGAVLLA